MRIRVLQRPPVVSIDGLRLDRFEAGYLYEVGPSLACLFLAEGWAKPVDYDEPALLVPLRETASDVDPRNLIREKYPPYIPDEFAIAADRRRKRPRNG